LTKSLQTSDALIAVQANASDGKPSYYKLAWAYQPEACGGHSRGDFIAAIRAEGIAIDAGFRGFTRRGPKRCRRPYPLPHSARASQDTLLLHHPVLLKTRETLDKVASAIHKVIREFRKQPIVEQ
jgi:hypothetical protein